jgi:uncharacterized protein YkwD
MRSPSRRLGPILLGAVLLLVLLPSGTSASDELTDSARAAAERAIVSRINRVRVDRGLRKLRVDPRLTEIARARSGYMASTGEFSHTQSGGTDAFDLITAARIKWYGAGEIIAWNTAVELEESATMAVRMWMGSPSHKAIVVSSGYNYFGLGLAVSPTSGKRYWTGIFIKGPDRTGAWAKVKSISTRAIDRTRSRVVLRWVGADYKLQVLTSGLRKYQTQRRVDGGAWFDYGTTTRTYAVRTWTRGRVWEFRIRAKDNAGNWGAWRTWTVRP